MCHPHILTIYILRIFERVLQEIREFLINFLVLDFLFETFFFQFRCVEIKYRKKNLLNDKIMNTI